MGGLSVVTGDSEAKYMDGTQLTCRIQTVSDTTNIQRVCEGAGKGHFGDPCSSPQDCGTGLTCVEENPLTVCRPYCCGNPESCPSNSYCTTRTTRISSAPLVTGVDVPVCSTADNCSLSEPYPCPQNEKCTCPSGEACMVVRRQGVTACAAPGTGQARRLLHRQLCRWLRLRQYYHVQVPQTLPPR